MKEWPAHVGRDILLLEPFCLDYLFACCIFFYYICGVENFCCLFLVVRVRYAVGIFPCCELFRLVCPDFLFLLVATSCSPVLTCILSLQLRSRPVPLAPSLSFHFPESFCSLSSHIQVPRLSYLLFIVLECFVFCFCSVLFCFVFFSIVFTCFHSVIFLLLSVGCLSFLLCTTC